jgi:hypothetical protein
VASCIERDTVPHLYIFKKSKMMIVNIDDGNESSLCECREVLVEYSITRDARLLCRMPDIENTNIPLKQSK